MTNITYFDLGNASYSTSPESILSRPQEESKTSNNEASSSSHFITTEAISAWIRPPSDQILSSNFVPFASPSGGEISQSANLKNSSSTELKTAATAQSGSKYLKKVILRVDLQNDKDMKKAMQTVSGVVGIYSISIDIKDIKKLTVVGDIGIDPVYIVSKLRKFFHTEIFTVGPAMEHEKKKDEPKKEEPNKKEPKKDGEKKDDRNKQIADLVNA